MRLLLFLGLLVLSGELSISNRLSAPFPKLLLRFPVPDPGSGSALYCWECLSVGDCENGGAWKNETCSGSLDEGEKWYCMAVFDQNGKFLRWPGVMRSS